MHRTFRHLTRDHFALMCSDEDAFSSPEVGHVLLCIKLGIRGSDVILNGGFLTSWIIMMMKNELNHLSFSCITLIKLMTVANTSLSIIETYSDCLILLKVAKRYVGIAAHQHLSAKSPKPSKTVFKTTITFQSLSECSPHASVCLKPSHLTEINLLHEQQQQQHAAT